MQAVQTNHDGRLTIGDIVSRACFGRTGKRAGQRTGGAVLETVLVLQLVLFVLVFPAMQFGYFFYLKHTLQGAAREGARAAIPASATNTDVQTAVASALSAAGLCNNTYGGAGGVTAKGFTVTPLPSDVSTATAGTAVTVTVSNTWGTIGLGFGGFVFNIPSSKAISGKTAMRKEG
jgi:Flp pilus assembly protein TadG